jgi:hypothetical protein
MGTEALGCTADNDADGISVSFRKDIVATLLADGAYTQRHQKISVKRQLKVGIERHEVRCNSWEVLREPSSWSKY